MVRKRMNVGGMTCDACNRHVEQAIARAGAQDPAADWRSGSVEFTASDDVDVSAVSAAVADAGYEPGAVSARETATATQSKRPRRDGQYDLLVLGAGSAAFAAAIRGRDAGARVAVVDHGTIGGTCVNVGCVPSKAVLRAAERFSEATRDPGSGVGTPARAADLAAIIRQKDALVGTMRKEKYEDLVAEYGFTFLEGHARFVDRDAIEIDGRRVEAGGYLIATGASPSAPPIPGLEEAGYVDSTTALELKELPRTIAVIGANAIGLELGQAFAQLGSRVTFLDVADRIAPFEEPEISEAMSAVLSDAGADVFAPAQVERVTLDGDTRVVHAVVDGTPRSLAVEQILVATGRRPNTESLGADAGGIELDPKGAIVVDEQLRTTNPKVYAAGDVTAAPQFVYVSAYQGALAADNLLQGAGRSVDLTALPRVTFTSPQIASVGMGEAQAVAAGYPVKATTLPLSAVPRALVNGDTRGLVKIVADASNDKILGVHILADGAGEVIQAAVYVVKLGLTVTDVAETWHPYLTMAESLKLAAQTFTRDVSKLSCCAA